MCSQIFSSIYGISVSSIDNLDVQTLKNLYHRYSTSTGTTEMEIEMEIETVSVANSGHRIASVEISSDDQIIETTQP